MTVNQVVFLLLAIVGALGAVGVVAIKNPIRSALCLVVNFFVLAFLYFSLGAELLGVTQIMVYAGAIMVLFLFVVMVLSARKREEERKSRDAKPLLATVLAAAMFLIVLAQVVYPLSNWPGSLVDDKYGSPQAIGGLLFSTYAWPFEVVSVLLLAGIVGSILLAKRRI